MTLVFFLEEPSANEMLKGILPRILPDDVHVRYVVFNGKQDLEKQIEKKLKNWLLPDTKFIILRDKDSGNCLQIKEILKQKCQSAGQNNTLIRILCHELESCYLGDLEAVEQGLKIQTISHQQNNRKYKNPDNLANAKQELIRLSKKQYQEISGSRKIAPYLKLNGENKSYSFNILLAGIKTICNE